MTRQSRKRATNSIRNDIAALEQKLGPIEYRPLASLKRYENNPRKHPEKQLVKLAASIREFGFAMPMLVDEQGIIFIGARDHRSRATDKVRPSNCSRHPRAGVIEQLYADDPLKTDGHRVTVRRDRS